MAIGLGDAFGGFAPLETPRVLPRAAVDALARLDDDALRMVVDDAAARMRANTHGHSISAGDEDGRDETAISVDQPESTAAAAACVLVCCARNIVCTGPDIAASSVRLAVANCGVDDEPLLARLVPLVSPHIAAVRATLRATSFDFAHVVDVSWRLDYVLRSSAAGNIHTPVYYVQLTVQPPQGAVRDVSFSCSVEGLRDLVYRLQDATNAIEKIAGVKPTTTNTPTTAVAIA